MFVTIDDISVEIIRKSIKNVSLRIYPPHGNVKLSVPVRYNDKQITQLIKDKLSWIKEKQALVRSRDYQPDGKLCTGTTLQFLGNSYLLVIDEHQGPSTIQINDQLIHCYVKPGYTQEKIQQVFKRWFQREMCALLPDLIAKWEPIIGVKVNQWGIRQMKTRWGSCNTRDKRISLNLNLIHKPLICLEYVLVHEMVHLLEASHNKRFYDFMTRFMPDWKEHQFLLERRSK